MFGPAREISLAAAFGVARNKMGARMVQDCHGRKRWTAYLGLVVVLCGLSVAAVAQAPPAAPAPPATPAVPVLVDPPGSAPTAGPAPTTSGKPKSKVAQTGKNPASGKNSIVKSSAGAKRSVDEQLLMELRLNGIILAEAIPAFINGSSLMLPLGELSTALDFPITVDSASGQAGGWFLSENRLFSLDNFTGEVIIEGLRSKYDASMAVVFESDIFVDIRLLSVLSISGCCRSGFRSTSPMTFPIWRSS